MNHELTEAPCPTCRGDGFVWTSFEHDCRDFDAWDHLWNLARERQKHNDEIINAIKTQEWNQVFDDRNGVLRVHQERAANFEYFTFALAEAARRRDAKKLDARRDVGRSMGMALVGWIIIGFAGCIFRLGTGKPRTAVSSHSSEYADVLTSPFASYLVEGVIAAAIVVAIGILVSIGRTRMANSEFEKLEGIYRSKGF